MDFNTAYHMLIDYDIATKSEIDLVVTINGTSLETLEDILYAREGYRHFESWEAENVIPKNSY